MFKFVKPSLYLLSSFAFFIGLAKAEEPKTTPRRQEMGASINVCDLGRIYSQDYKYSLPEGVLISFLSGNSFDWKKDYTEDEAKRIQEDIQAIWERAVEGAKMYSQGDQKLVATISAGAPGAGKTVVMNQLRKKEESSGKVPYICPDDVCLKQQANTYNADIKAGMDKSDAYTKWRPASNAANHIVLGNLIRGDGKGKRYPLFFGTTSQSHLTHLFYTHLKEHGYKIRVIHVSAPDTVRKESIKIRDKTFVQTTDEDIRDKGLEVTKRVQDTFLKLADTIEFYYRSEATKDATLAATWTRDEASSPLQGKVAILNKEAYEGIKATHNIATQVLKDKGEEAMTWEEAFESTLTNPEALKSLLSS
jgi:hypothetical protein